MDKKDKKILKAILEESKKDNPEYKEFYLRLNLNQDEFNEIVEKYRNILDEVLYETHQYIVKPLIN